MRLTKPCSLLPKLTVTTMEQTTIRIQRRRRFVYHRRRRRCRIHEDEEVKFIPEGATTTTPATEAAPAMPPDLPSSNSLLAVNVIIIIIIIITWSLDGELALWLRVVDVDLLFFCPWRFLYRFLVLSCFYVHFSRFKFSLLFNWNHNMPFYLAPSLSLPSDLLPRSTSTIARRREGLL
jgi:hypothetical protein